MSTLYRIDIDIKHNPILTVGAIKISVGGLGMINNQLQSF